MVFAIIAILISLIGITALVGMIKDMDDKARLLEQGSKVLHISNVTVGGVVHLRNIGPERKAFDVEIEGHHLYREGIYEWTELEGLSPEGKVWITVEQYDGLEVSVVVEKLRLHETSLEEAELERIWEREEGNVHFDERKFVFDECGQANYYKDFDTSQRAAFKYWSFHTINGKYLLTVEKWLSDNSYDVFLSQSLSPSSQIKVFRNRTEEQTQSA